MQRGLVTAIRKDLGSLIPSCRLGTWNVTSLTRKKPELVREVEKVHLDIVRLTLMLGLLNQLP